MSILAALGAMVCWGFGDFFIQKSTRKIGDVETLAWIGIIGSIGFFPFVYKDLFLVLERSSFLILLFLGVVTFIVGIINFEALKRGKLSIVEVLLEFELPITIALGLFFLNESLSWIQVFLITLIFSGIIMIAWRPNVKGEHFFEKGAVLAIFTAIGYGLINFLTAVGAKQISPLLTIWFTWAVFTIICLIWLKIRGNLNLVFKKFFIYPELILSIGILDTLAWVFFALAVQKQELAITIAITESYPAISLLLGTKFNKEKISRYQLIGAIITIGASFLIAFI